MQTQRIASGKCLVTVLVTIGVLSVLGATACCLVGYFVVRQQRVYQDPEEVVKFAKTFCDVSLMEGFQPDTGGSFGLFGARMNFVSFEKDPGTDNATVVTVGRAILPGGSKQSPVQIRQNFTTRSPANLPGRSLTEQYYVRREIEGTTVHVWVSLYAPAANVNGSSATPQAGSTEQGETASPEPQETIDIATKEGGAEEKTATTEEPLIPPSKQGELVVVAAVRELQDGAAFVQIVTPRAKWDEDFFWKLLMSIH